METRVDVQKNCMFCRASFLADNAIDSRQERWAALKLVVDSPELPELHVSAEMHWQFTDQFARPMEGGAEVACVRRMPQYLVR